MHKQYCSSESAKHEYRTDDHSKQRYGYGKKTMSDRAAQFSTLWRGAQALFNAGFFSGKTMSRAGRMARDVAARFANNSYSYPRERYIETRTYRERRSHPFRKAIAAAAAFAAFRAFMRRGYSDGYRHHSASRRDPVKTDMGRTNERHSAVPTVVHKTTPSCG